MVLHVLIPQFIPRVDGDLAGRMSARKLVSAGLEIAGPH